MAKPKNASLSALAEHIKPAAPVPAVAPVKAASPVAASGTGRVSLYLSPELYEELRTAAYLSKRSMNEIVIDALANHLRHVKA
jgi:hypothetical protein